MAHEDGPPRIVIEALSEDQRAMLELLGEPEIERRGSPLYFEDAPAGIRQIDPSLNPNVVRQYMCPVVRWRGRLRMILPNGDLAELREE